MVTYGAFHENILFKLLRILRSDYTLIHEKDLLHYKCVTSQIKHFHMLCQFFQHL